MSKRQDLRPTLKRGIRLLRLVNELLGQLVTLVRQLLLLAALVSGLSFALTTTFSLDSPTYRASVVELVRQLHLP